MPVAKPPRESQNASACAEVLRGRWTHTIGSTARCEGIAEGGRAKRQTGFSEESICNRYLEFLDRMVAEKKRAEGRFPAPPAPPIAVPPGAR